MINKTAFTQWITLFGEKFNKPLSAPSQLVFYDLCNAELTTDEFVAGAKLVYRDNTFFPSPKELIEKAKPTANPALEAADVFRDILTWNGSENLMAAARVKLTDIGLRAFLAVGGPAKFRTLLASEEVFVRREFVAAYTAARQDAKERERADRMLAEVQAPAHLHGNTIRKLTGPQHIGDALKSELGVT
jgi:hypothetical protein